MALLALALPLSAPVACAPGGAPRAASEPSPPATSTPAPTPAPTVVAAPADAGPGDASAAGSASAAAPGPPAKGEAGADGGAALSDVIGAQPAVGSWLRIDTVETKGPLGSETLRGVLAPHLEAALDCYAKKAGKQAKRPEGALQFRFTIGKKGAPQGVEPVGKSALDAAFTGCILAAVRKATFPPADAATRASVSLFVPPAASK